MPTFTEKLIEANQASFHVLDLVKAKRMKAKAMFIPAPEDVARVTSAIPVGDNRTILEFRRELMVMSGAESACPGALERPR
jgi:hypothetical protein